MRTVDVPLVRAFIEREAQDFRPVKDTAWVEFRMNKILAVYPGARKLRDIMLRSIGNTGVVTRQLFLEPSPYDWEGPVMAVTFCNCGRDECWGHIDFLDQYPEGGIVAAPGADEGGEG